MGDNPAFDISDEDQVKEKRLSEEVHDVEKGPVVFEDLSDEESGGSCCFKTDQLTEYHKDFSEFKKRHEKSISLLKCILVAIVYNGFLISAIVYHLMHRSEEKIDPRHGLGFLIAITSIVYIYMFVQYIFKPVWKWFFRSTAVGQEIREKVFKSAHDMYKKFMKKSYSNAIIYITVACAISIFLIVDSLEDISRLRSMLGTIVLVILGVIFSKHPTRICWRTVVWGLVLQFLLGLLVLRWSVGNLIFEIFGDKVSDFLAFTDVGSSFVYGYLVDQKPFNLAAINATLEPEAYNVINVINSSRAMNAVFAFKILNVILFFSFVVSMLFYLGALQWAIKKIGWLLQSTMGSTACESLSASANIFLGQTEAPLLIRPFLPRMTPSEIHAVMTGGFATISGSVLAAYILFGVSSNHLLSASVMSAPAALACAKLLYPETKKSLTTIKDIEEAKNVANQSSNILDAASQGAITAVFLVANVAGSLVAVLSFVAFINGILGFIGGLLGHDGLTIEFIFGKIFIPLSWLMGVNNDDLELVGQLIGVKSFVNEFAAYAMLGEIRGKITERSTVIVTYALCGFSNPASIGIQIAGLSTLVPERRDEFASVAFRAYVAGSLACFLTACVAGALVA